VAQSLALRRLLLVLGAVAGAGVIGVAAGGGLVGAGSTKTLAILCAACSLWLLDGLNRPLFAALILLLATFAIDAVPVAALYAGKPVYLTIALAVVLAFRARNGFTKVPSSIRIASICLFVCWLAGVLRAIAIGAPTTKTLEFGCFFALFAILLPAYVSLMQDERFRHYLTVGFGVIAVWVAVTNSAAALGALPAAGTFVHAYRVIPDGSLERVYTLSGELPIAAIPFALGAALIGPGLRRRLVAGFVLIPCIASVVLSLTRASYLGLAAMFAIMVVLWGARYGRQALVLVVTCAVVIFVAASVGPLRGPISTALTRTESIFNSSASASDPSGNTVAFREDEEGAIRAATTTLDWAVGRGFLPSPWYTFTPDSMGSLLDTDLGWYNALNTMGLVGVLLVFALPVCVMVICWRARKIERSKQWIVFGGMGYAIYTLIVSQTLVTLFSAFGLSVAAAAFGLAVATVSSEPQSTYPPQCARPVGGAGELW
jgi:hypothetical protein